MIFPRRAGRIGWGVGGESGGGRGGERGEGGRVGRGERWKKGLEQCLDSRISFLLSKAFLMKIPKSLYKGEV